MDKSSILQPVRSFQWSQVAHNNLGEFDPGLGMSRKGRLEVANIFQLGLFAGGGGIEEDGGDEAAGAEFVDDL